jgi:hypothetical protein
MNNSIVKKQSEQGSITVIALMILVVLTILGITISRTATIDVQIAGNEIPFKQNFYVAEGGIHRESSEVGQGQYPVLNVQNPSFLANQTGLDNGNGIEDAGGEGDPSSLPAPIPHRVANRSYDFSLNYLGFYLPPQGYSVIHFSRYDYSVDAFGDPNASRIRVASRYYKIGPKAE